MSTTDSKTAGAWIVHHSLKLQQVTGVQDYNNLYAAGKAGLLLSALSSTQQTSLSVPQVESLAKAANINTLFELPKLLDLLKGRHLIEPSPSGVDILGLTTSTVLQ